MRILLEEEATRLAVVLDHAAYDCVYLPRHRVTAGASSPPMNGFCARRASILRRRSLGQCCRWTETRYKAKRDFMKLLPG